MQISKLYRKLTLANSLNWFAVKFLYLAKIFSGKIISIAIRLDPSRKIFQQNLESLKLNEISLFKKFKLPYYSILEGCKNLSSEIIFHEIGKNINLLLPKVINNSFKVSDKYRSKAKLPDIYLVLINDAKVFAGTDLIVVENVILYDEVNKNTFINYAIKSPIILKTKYKNIGIKIPKKEISIEIGIHFTKDHSKNYFHWLIECLPRFSLIDKIDNKIPLLVDKDLPKQFYDALSILNQNNRKLLKIDSGTTYKINKLYYPSQLSVVHDNYNNPIYNQDAIYSKKAINYVRDNVLKKITSQNNQIKSRKLYLSRKNSNYRQLLNSNEIEDFLTKNGFEIIFPEYLSFFAQVQIFSQAKIIVGQSGAGMANFIFAPKDSRILIMMSDVAETNLHLFGLIAQALDINLEYIIGKSLVVRKKYSIHSDFYVDIEILKDYLNKELII